MTLAEDQSHLLHALLRNGVEFVIVGGTRCTIIHLEGVLAYIAA